MVEWLEPMAKSYLHHVTKARIVQALKEAGPDLVCDVNGLKKEALATTAAARLAGTRWLPEPLRGVSS